MTPTEEVIKYNDSSVVHPQTKQGKKDPCIGCTNDKGCVTCEQGELRETPTRTVNADEVIAWLVANICDYEYYVEWFKQDFKL